MWIEVHQSLPGHRKTKKLKRMLKVKEPAAVGHLVMLWLWCIDSAADGDLSQLEDEDIAEAAGWPGDPERFRTALTDAGFLDEDGKLHDWKDYASFNDALDRAEEKRANERERKRRWREKNRQESGTVPRDNPPVVPPVSRDCPTGQGRDRNGTVPRDGDVPGTSRHVPNLTRPNLTIPNLSTETTDYTLKDSGTGDDLPGQSSSEKEAERALSFYRKQVERDPIPGRMAAIEAYTEQMGADVVIQAFSAAISAGNTSWPYIDGILRNKLAQGVRSLEDWHRVERQRAMPGVNPAGAELPGLGDVDRMMAELEGGREDAEGT